MLAKFGAAALALLVLTGCSTTKQPDVKGYLSYLSTVQQETGMTSQQLVDLGEGMCKLAAGTKDKAEFMDGVLLMTSSQTSEAAQAQISRTVAASLNYLCPAEGERLLGK